ncbi:MAG TPA: peptidylprolyl isomerase [Pyrinomonadaceae bacterium]|nr:peptidylprolyl isomerase [Pyrinomonadaceae bacterium]
MPGLFRQKRHARVALVLSLIFSGCAAGTSSQSNANSNSIPAVVATVNNREIPTRLYEMYLKNGREELGLDPATEEGRGKIEQLKEGIVSELIDRTLIMDEAERRGLSIPPQKMEAAIARTVQQFGGDEKYDAYLAAHRLKRDEYLEVVKMELYGELLRAELNKKLSVADDEIKKYYEAHKAEPIFQQPERVTAAHILIAARPNLISQQFERDKHLSGEALAAAVREEVARRRRLAEELRVKASRGADFAGLARQYSEDPSSREQGGDLGTFARGTHTRAFDEAAFALKPGQLSGVVQTEYGFHVIKVNAKEAARALTLAEATPEIRRRLLADLEATKLTETLKEMRRKAKVRINEPFRVGALKDEFPQK